MSSVMTNWCSKCSNMFKWYCPDFSLHAWAWGSKLWYEYPGSLANVQQLEAAWIALESSPIITHTCQSGSVSFDSPPKCHSKSMWSDSEWCKEQHLSDLIMLDLVTPCQTFIHQPHPPVSVSDFGTAVKISWVPWKFLRWYCAVKHDKTW